AAVLEEDVGVVVGGEAGEGLELGGAGGGVGAGVLGLGGGGGDSGRARSPLWPRCGASHQRGGGGPGGAGRGRRRSGAPPGRPRGRRPRGGNVVRWASCRGGRSHGSSLPRAAVNVEWRH